MSIIEIWLVFAISLLCGIGIGYFSERISRKPEKEIVIEWIVKNVDASDVPADEGNDDGLVYNLVHKVIEGDSYQWYDYRDSQDSEICALYEKYRRNK